MKVTKVWENCDFLNGEWARQRITSYWVEVNRAELDKVLARAAKPGELKSEIKANAGSDPQVYFLVSKGLESIVNLPSYYPESGQWNEGSPFRDLEPHEIKDLNELAAL